MAGPGFGGYLNEVHNKGAFVDGNWVNSGDLGRLDKDGFLWITGRAKDLVIRGGHNIDPAPVEEILFQHPAVGLAAVVGQPDAYAGELPVGDVRRSKPGATVAAGELEAWVRERTPERAVLRFKFKHSIPYLSPASARCSSLSSGGMLPPESSPELFYR